MTSRQNFTCQTREYTVNSPSVNSPPYRLAPKVEKNVKKFNKVEKCQKVQKSLKMSKKFKNCQKVQKFQKHSKKFKTFKKVEQCQKSSNTVKKVQKCLKSQKSSKYSKIVQKKEKCSKMSINLNSSKSSKKLRNVKEVQRYTRSSMHTIYNTQRRYSLSIFRENLDLFRKTAKINFCWQIRSGADRPLYPRWIRH